MKKFNKSIGDYCENLACNYLIKNKYYILEKNFRNHFGELDIICKINNILVIVEVKGRYSKDFGAPMESVNLYKQKSIIKLTNSYLSLKHLVNVNVRFDVVEIYLNDYDNSYTLNHIIDAFRV